MTNKLKIKNGGKEIHELWWQKYSAEVTKSSTVIVPEIITLATFQKYANNGIFVNVVSMIK